eukprot:692631-Pyramimonas_sp.AAC.1
MPVRALTRIIQNHMRAPPRAHDQSDGFVELARADFCFNLVSFTAITCLIDRWTSASSTCLLSLAPLSFVPPS